MFRVRLTSTATPHGPKGKPDDYGSVSCERTVGVLSLPSTKTPRHPLAAGAAPFSLFTYANNITEDCHAIPDSAT